MELDDLGAESVPENFHDKIYDNSTLSFKWKQFIRRLDKERALIIKRKPSPVQDQQLHFIYKGRINMLRLSDGRYMIIIEPEETKELVERARAHRRSLPSQQRTTEKLKKR